MNPTIIHFLATGKYSGAENVAISIINHTDTFFETYYCSPKGSIEKILKKRRVKYLGINKLSMSEIKKVLKEKSPTIIHAHDFKASLYCSILKKRQKLIIHLHNNDPKLKKLSIKSILLLLSSLRADRILTVSKSIEREYIFSNLIKHKTICIGNPLDREIIIKQASEYSVEEEFDICCIARITQQKNPKRFIEIINKTKETVKDLRCIWIGDGELRQEMQDQIEKEGLQNNIILKGNIENPFPYLLKSKLFVLTSAWEGFGLVAFEALSLGKPAIVSNVGGLPTIVDNKCGKVCNNDKQFINIILSLLKNKKLYKAYSQNATNKSIKLNNINNYMLQVNSIYNQLRISYE